MGGGGGVSERGWEMGGGGREPQGLGGSDGSGSGVIRPAWYVRPRKEDQSAHWQCLLQALCQESGSGGGQGLGGGERDGRAGGRAGVRVEMGRAERVTHARRCREGKGLGFKRVGGWEG